MKSDKIPISWFQMVSDGIKTAAPRLLGGLLPGRKAEELFRGGTGLDVPFIFRKNGPGIVVD